MEFISPKVSRRKLLKTLAITGMITSATRPNLILATHQIDDSAVEIIDIRRGPTVHGTSFLLEIFNASDRALDTPAYGTVSLAKEPIWANPASLVLPAQSSGILTGFIPDKTVKADELLAAEWVLCNHLSDNAAAELEGWDIDISHELLIFRKRAAQVNISIVNNSKATSPQRFRVEGIIRDQDSRVCGTTLASNLGSISPDTTKELTLYITDDIDYTSSPFRFIESLRDISLELNIQPEGILINPNCPSIMPWNT